MKKPGVKCFVTHCPFKYSAFGILSAPGWMILSVVFSVSIRKYSQLPRVLTIQFSGCWSLQIVKLAIRIKSTRTFKKITWPWRFDASSLSSYFSCVYGRLSFCSICVLYRRSSVRQVCRHTADRHTADRHTRMAASTPPDFYSVLLALSPLISHSPPLFLVNAIYNSPAHPSPQHCEPFYCTSDL